MTRLALACLALSGCSLLFDPSGIVPARKDGGAFEDMHSSVDDLSVLEDLAAPLDQSFDASADLTPPPDLLTVDLRPCVPPAFVGFFDGGSPDPFNCNSCGCTLDDFSNPAATALKFTHSINAGWSESYDGGLTLSANGAVANTQDVYNTAGHAYLDGDFDLLLDFQIQNWTVGGNFLFYVIGPNVDGGVPYDPFGYQQIYLPGVNGIFYLILYTDDRFLDVITTTTSGTLRLRRTGNQLCSSIVGHEEQCHTGTAAARVFVQLQGLTNSAACGAACDYHTRVSNLRLSRGTVVSKP